VLELAAGTMLARGFSSSASCMWPLARAGDLFALRYGKALVEGSRRPGCVPVFGTNGQCGWHDIPLFKGPGVILGRKGQGPLGVEWSESDYWVIDTAYSLEIRHPEMDLRFAYYLIKYVGLNHLKDGTSNPSLSRDTFGTQAFPIPPLAEQRRIVAVLRALDDKIELNRRMNGTMEAMAQALFKSWFVDFDPVRAKMAGRAPSDMDVATAALFPARMDATVPAGWHVRRYSEAVTVTRGKSYKSDDLQPASTALVTLKSFLRGGGYRDDGLKGYAGAYKREQVVRPGELVIAFTDVTQAAEVIGKPALVRPSNSFSTLVASLDVGIVRPRVASLPLEFLYYSFLGPGFQEHAYAHSNGSTVLHLSSDAIEKYEGLWPSESCVDAFRGFVRPLLDVKNSNWAQNEILAALRDLLLPKLLAGEVLIRDAEREVEKVA